MTSWSGIIRRIRCPLFAVAGTAIPLTNVSHHSGVVSYLDSNDKPMCIPILGDTILAQPCKLHFIHISSKPAGQGASTDSLTTPPASMESAQSRSLFLSLCPDHSVPIPQFPISPGHSNLLAAILFKPPQITSWYSKE
uniref:Uncharacterized protein n=1 Tax=Pipistrellus kuhlii TaxID=59472 RepID=A0A7J7WLC8_PIPKU|nr:hypothetical protein mPipKuh1_007962 [Pipistrellus kuhlii]